MTASRRHPLHHTTTRLGGSKRSRTFPPSGEVWISIFQFPIFSMANNSQSSTKPVKVLRLRGISASIFENPTKTNGRDSVFYKVSIQRTYKDGDDFKTTSSFGRDDLPIVSLLSQRAWEYVLTLQSDQSDS